MKIQIIRPKKDLGLNRHLLVHEDSREPVLVAVATRESATAPSRLKVALGVPIEESNAFALLAEFRLEMN